MVLFSIPVQQQIQVSKTSWPRIMEGLATNTLIEQFQRENLLPTGTPTIYTVASTGGGSAVMNSAGSVLVLTTAGAIGNDVDVRYEIVFSRASSWAQLDPKSLLNFDIMFTTGSSVATVEGFIGLVLSTTNAITALPTTATHIGVFWDISAGANFTMSSANGTTQATTGSGIAVQASTLYRLHVEWTGLNSATTTLYSGGSGPSAALSTAGSTHTITDLNSNNAFKMHFFIQNEATASRTVNIGEWKVESL